ncbi:hypothetical protein B6E78_06780 [Edwardsiella ictaluri]|uniref:Ig-like domain-containing protein n=1 Tax=Edwardsiella ictaluri TaxID=67780 RepID=UPI0009BC8F16|nr:Ig-like domain-containing protein [Edwardsiella ictaluri]ARD39128.1 hypothetical protein B6E78_06780 [Edwardsiella ictaluri]
MASPLPSPRPALPDRRCTGCGTIDADGGTGHHCCQWPRQVTVDPDLKDGNGNPVDGQTVTFSSSLANTTFGSVTDNHDGTYSAELAGTTAGTASVSARVNGQPFAVSPASVTLTADAPDAAQSTLTAAPATIVANGLAKSLLTLTLKDGNGNLIDGQTVTFSSSLADITFGAVTDNHDGTYSAELAGTTAGTASVSARVNGQPFAVSPASVT